MRLFPRTVRHAAITIGAAALLGLAVSVPAQARAAEPSVPFSSCNYGVPKGTPLVVLADVEAQPHVPPKQAGFGFTGPYDLVARHILGPFGALYNYSNCRVWLHQHANPLEHGWTICFSPHRFGNSPAVPRKYAYAGSMVISGNTRGC